VLRAIDLPIRAPQTVIGICAETPASAKSTGLSQDHRGDLEIGSTSPANQKASKGSDRPYEPVVPNCRSPVCDRKRDSRFHLPYAGNHRLPAVRYLLPGETADAITWNRSTVDGAKRQGMEEIRQPGGAVKAQPFFGDYYFHDLRREPYRDPTDRPWRPLYRST